MFSCSGGACSTTVAVEGEVVTDSLTGLVWQRTFSPIMTWQAAISYCETLDYGGQKDWRLPNPFELESILDNQKSDPPIDTTMFPGTSFAFWSSPYYIIDTNKAWVVTLTTSIVYYYPKTNNYYARCVRGGTLGVDGTSRYIVTEPVPSQQIVADVTTGLIWQGNYVSGKNWQQALNYCALLNHGGFTDWRLPNKNELMSLVNYSMYDPATDFPGTPQTYFYSSSSNALNTDNAWRVSFYYGGVGYCQKDITNSARCMREENCGPSPTGKGGDMCDVPAGDFWMGCNSNIDADCLSSEYPYHSVAVPAFKIDKYEVTVSQYAACQSSSPGTCTTPATNAGCNWGVSGFDNHPINCVDWTQAKAYCTWVGKRLPTEAEWEKAARGIDGRKYPWGNTDLNCDHVVFNGCYESTAAIGSKPLGASPYGVLDMSGNVWEWVEDDYHDNYNNAPTNGSAWIENPRSSYRMIRGGAWLTPGTYVRTSTRGSTPALPYRGVDLGFRCARD
jgi:formylglycine-generating enzyme required for sulfatase activity